MESSSASNSNQDFLHRDLHSAAIAAAAAPVIRTTAEQYADWIADFQNLSLSPRSGPHSAENRGHGVDCCGAALTKLPPELIYSITDHLPDESTSALRMVSRYFRAIIPQRWETSNLDLETRVNLRLLLQRSRPDHLACRVCGRLFKIKITVRPHVGYKCPRGLPCLVWCGPLTKQIYHRGMLDMLLKDSLADPFLERRISTLDRFQTKTNRGRYHAEKLAVRHYVVDGELLVAAKFVTALSTTEFMGRRLEQITSMACCHFVDDFQLFIAGMFERRHEMTRADKCLAVTENICCTVCASDYTISAVPEYTGIVRLVYRAWHNLGGLHPDQPDVYNLWVGYRPERPRSSAVEASDRDIEYRIDQHIRKQARKPRN